MVKTLAAFMGAAVMPSRLPFNTGSVVYHNSSPDECRNDDTLISNDSNPSEAQQTDSDDRNDETLISNVSDSSDAQQNEEEAYTLYIDAVKEVFGLAELASAEEYYTVESNRDGNSQQSQGHKTITEKKEVC